MRPTMTAKSDVRITQLRDWIASAEREGVQRSDMQLHLSHRDLAGLKRSKCVSMEEITFFSGVMRFLGVEVIAAATATSSIGRRVQA